MKQINQSILAILVFSGLFFSEDIQAQLNIDAQLRSRFEIRDGYRQLAPDGSFPVMFVSQRTRLSISYESENLKLKFTPQDVRIWGDEQIANSTGIYGDNASLDLLEAFAEIKLGKLGWISVGRQQLVYDSQRLLGARNWNQNGLAYDALIFKKNINKWNLHAGGTWNTSGDSPIDNLYLPERIKTLDYLWINYALNESLNISFLHIASGSTESDSTRKLNFRQTTGLSATYKSEKLNFKSNTYYQYGKNNQGIRMNAFLCDADLSYKFQWWNIGLGTSYLSGDSNPGDNTDHLFNVLYGARHRYFGNMDYFRDFSKHTNEGGLSDIYGYFDIKFPHKISLNNTTHYFSLAKTNSLTPPDKQLGIENDITLTFKLNKWCAIKGAYLFFLPSPALNTLQSVPVSKFSQYIYLELTIKPSFI